MPIPTKKVNKAYNDGVCTICRETKDASTFSARVGATSADDLEAICTMQFAENSVRMEDSSYAEQMGYRLDRKISIRKPGGIRIDTECSAVIGRTLYHVAKAEYTREEVYLSLTEVRELEVDADAE
ncbi:MAG: hypothetical protein LUI87_02270 [Lachnospiraceae bacterium]|nr:hypothetical protein [Lachnospiraceae bacterium]